MTLTGAEDRTATPTLVEFFGDPSCPWTWITARWLVDVAQARNIEVRWHTFSIESRDGGELSTEIPEPFREAARAGRVLSRRAMRVFEAVRDAHGEAAVGPLYAALGHRLFVAGQLPTAPSPTVLADALAEAGLPASLEAAGDDPSWDDTIEQSTQRAHEAVGSDAMSPTIVIDEPGRPGMCGPVLSAAPTGRRAEEIWDAMVQLAFQPDFVEIRRARTGPPRFPTVN